MRLDDKNPDPLHLLARANAAKGGRRSGMRFLIALAVVVAGLAVLVWLNLPEPEPVPLVVIAADDVTVSGEASVVRAWLRPLKEQDEAGSLAGREVFFLDSRAASPGGDRAKNLLSEKAISGADGEASIRWTFPDDSAGSVVVRFPGNKPPSYDGARIFVWPARTKILVVEARHALMAAEEKAFHKAHVTNIPSLPGAGAALKTAKNKGYHIVYLATAPARPEDYRKLRGWLQRRSPAGREVFPEGPTLARASYAEDESVEAASRTVLAALKRRFQGALIAVAGRAGDAELFQKQGVQSYLVGETADAPAHVKHVKAWPDLVQLLP